MLTYPGNDRRPEHYSGVEFDNLGGFAGAPKGQDHRHKKDDTRQAGIEDIRSPEPTLKVDQESAAVSIGFDLFLKGVLEEPSVTPKAPVGIIVGKKILCFFGKSNGVETVRLIETGIAKVIIEIEDQVFQGGRGDIP